MFIVLEGIDGTGKSTQARRLAEWFEGQTLRPKHNTPPKGGE